MRSYMHICHQVRSFALVISIAYCHCMPLFTLMAMFTQTNIRKKVLRMESDWFIRCAVPMQQQQHRTLNTQSTTEATQHNPIEYACILLVFFAFRHL